jgi:putative nucleotidyltransferase with HDIG domain
MIRPASSSQPAGENRQSAGSYINVGKKVARFKAPGLWIPIRAKITVPFLLIALAMALGMAFVLYQIIFENIDQRFNTQLVESGKLASEWMVQEENQRLATLRLLIYTQGVGDTLKAGNSDQLRLDTWGLVIGHQEEAVEFLDSQGKLVLSMRHHPDSQKVEDYLYASGGDFNYRQWPFVQKVIDGQADSNADKYSGLGQASWGNYFYVSGPVYDRAGNFAGVVLVGRTISTLVREMHEDILAQVTIYGLNGTPVASTFTAPPLSIPEVQNTLANQAASSLRIDSDSRRSLTFSHIDYAEILGPWKLRGIDDGLIGTAIPKNFLVQTSSTTRGQIALLVGLGLFLVLIAGGIIASYITRPLLNLVNASKEIAKGNLKISVQPQSNDEVAVLTRNFNQMIASITQSRDDLISAYDSTLLGWSRATDLRDNETQTHTLQVTKLAVQLAEKMGLTGIDLTNIYRGALLHDVGKIGVPDYILRKPGELTETEWAEMHRHPQYAYDMLIPIDYLRPAIDIPYCHHEKWDGSGYPRGLKGEEIPLAARIFAVVDVWNAMTSERIYRKAIPEEVVIKYLVENQGIYFDPQVVRAFIPLVSGQ